MVVNAVNRCIQSYYCSAYREDKSILEDKKEVSVQHGSIYVKDALGNVKESIYGKKLHAKKQALRSVLDQFMKDQKTDEKIDSYRGEKQRILSESEDVLKQVNDIKKQQEGRAEEYGVSKDS